MMIPGVLWNGLIFFSLNNSHLFTHYCDITHQINHLNLNSIHGPEHSINRWEWKYSRIMHRRWFLYEATNVQIDIVIVVIFVMIKCKIDKIFIHWMIQFVTNRMFMYLKPLKSLKPTLFYETDLKKKVELKKKIWLISKS